MVGAAAQPELLSCARECRRSPTRRLGSRYVTVKLGTSWLAARNMSLAPVSSEQMVQMLVASVISGAFRAVHGDGTDSAGCGK